MSIAISARGISKKYTIGTARRQHNTLRDAIMHGVKAPFRGRRSRKSTEEDILWAVKDMTFDVGRGELLGIIGRNGAGKSTLLKILSRITEPSAGRCEIYGRIASLLEVGTGFHGELTGRENIYFNGSILGMRKAEIDRQFDAIVAFAEVERFIDTPVKRYSSGMYVRLAFAVAAHLNPEILIVDEVLAVGDLKFQNKCLGKLGEVAAGGRTVLFVSHNMGALGNLCTTGMWIDSGEIRMRGDIKSVVAAYIKKQTEGAIGSLNRADDSRRGGSGEARIDQVRLLGTDGNESSAFLMGDTLVLEFDVVFHRRLPNINITIELNRLEFGMRVVQIQSDDAGFGVHDVGPGVRRYRVEIPQCMLYPDNYEIMMAVWDQTKVLDYIEGAASFSMIQSDVTRRTTPLNIHRQAIYYTPTRWQDVSSTVKRSAVVGAPLA